MKKKRMVLAAMLALWMVGTTQAPIFAGAEEKTSASIETAKNVIIMIGDGMGPNQVKAGGIYKGEPLNIQKMAQTSFSETCSANNVVTDSAAGATALATGVRTNNGMVGINPDGKELTTIMDIALKNGKRTGVVTTDVLSGATPMGFSAHYNDRDASAELLASAANSGVNLFVSTTKEYSAFIDKSGNVYESIANVENISESQSNYVIGGYSISASASSMSASSSAVAFDKVVSEALEYLSKDPDGFVLMAEGARIDKAGHNSDFNQMLAEMLAFDDAVKVVLDWAENRDDTVVIVTADHETGGLLLDENATKENLTSSYEWTSGGNHTSTDVYCKVYGREIDFARYSSFGKTERLKNIDIFQMMQSFVSGKQDVTVENVKPFTLYGSIAFDKTAYTYGEKVVITAKPDESCELYSLKVNDEEMISRVENNVLEYVISAGRVKVSASFKKVKTVYDISYESLGDKGEYTVNPTTVTKGDKLIVKITPAEGYEIEKVTFDGVEMTKTAENTYEILPNSAGMVKVAFKEVGTGNGETNKSGCGGSISSVAFMIPIAVAACVLCNKKED